VQSCDRAEIIKYTSLKYLCLCKKYWYSIQWSSGNTGLVRWISRWIDSLSDRSILLKSVFIIYLEYAKVPHVFFLKYFFYRVFCTSKFTSKNISVSRKISYNRNPVKSMRQTERLSVQCDIFRYSRRNQRELALRKGYRPALSSCAPSVCTSKLVLPGILVVSQLYNNFVPREFVPCTKSVGVFIGHVVDSSRCGIFVAGISPQYRIPMFRPVTEITHCSIHEG
jgi:hypothetical protein